jgi:DNA mismatch repair protein MutL
LPDIITLLPDNIANQIAAGEVIQRPASAVKELLENAVDAGALKIHLIFKDAGKELIRVIDDGKGMSATDARMCWERHATSKIKDIADLFSIRTMGFRGEALASIAAIAQVELKTKLHHEEVGTYIAIEGTQVLKQEPCATVNGTTISIKNLFYNVPARRTFLKSNTTEIRHIIDEFTRVAMAFPEVSFKLSNGDTDIFMLEAGNLKQRIIALTNNNYSNKLVNVDAPTEYLSVSGFIGTPDAASKTRGHQYFFVNNRFIKSAYLNHAVNQAYSQLIAKDEFPTFALYLQIDPAKIDANVHPTKQEIKFEDDKIIYAFVNSAVKHALSKNSIAPSLDFTLDANITNMPSVTHAFTLQQKEKVQNEYLYNSFKNGGTAHLIERNNSAKNWQSLYQINKEITDTNDVPPSMQYQDVFPEKRNTYVENELEQQGSNDVGIPFQILGKYIIYPKANGILLINIRRATERINYDVYNDNYTTNSIGTQQLLHPITISLNTSDSLILTDLLNDINTMGYAIEPFGNNTFIVQAAPSDCIQDKINDNIIEIIDDYKNNSNNTKSAVREKLLIAMSHHKAHRGNTMLQPAAIIQLCNSLFTSTQPNYSPRGEKIFVSMSTEEIEKKFANV